MYEPPYLDGMEPDPDLLTEARITTEHIQWLRKKFNMARRTSGSPLARLSLGGFTDFVVAQRLIDVQDAEMYFYAMDRDKDLHLTFKEFLQGFCAADPQTVHIINSSTGLERLRFIFDFYNTSKSGTLTYGELAELVASANHHRLEHADLCQETTTVANNLADLCLVTISLVGLAGQIGSIRVSSKWSWWKVKHEIELVAGIPADSQTLVLCARLLSDSECVEASIPEGVSGDTLQVTVIRKSSEKDDSSEEVVPNGMRSSAEDDAGEARFMHVTFDRFLASTQKEELRGFSKLFRFKKSWKRKADKAVRAAGA